MIPCVALVGRPNVGKSTLFNRLTRRRDALVADVPGLTRDRRYGRVTTEAISYRLVDTGGMFGDEDIAGELDKQIQVALDEADLALFVVDARAGFTAADAEIAERLRRAGVPVTLVVNKIDGVDSATVESEFTPLGFDDPIAVAAEHGRGMGRLNDAVHTRLQSMDPQASRADESAEPALSDSGESETIGEAIRVALVGRPNVGKSTLVNRLAGEERQVVFDAPGTTRDAIDVPIEHGGRRYTLIDTAGVRRKGRTRDVVEKFSIVKALDAIERAHVVIVVIDATEGVVDQDLQVLRYALERGCAIVVAANKWDGLSSEQRRHAKATMDRRLDFIPWAPVGTISALHGTGVGHLWRWVDRGYQSGQLDVGTSVLTRVLEGLVRAHPPPSVRGRAIKLRFAHKRGAHPPTIAVHGNQTDALPAGYRRYLENGFRDALDLVATPVKLVFETSANPFAGKRNTLTPRQQRRRRRVIAHGRKKR